MPRISPVWCPALVQSAGAAWGQRFVGSPVLTHRGNVPGRGALMSKGATGHPRRHGDDFVRFCVDLVSILGPVGRRFSHLWVYFVRLFLAWFWAPCFADFRWILGSFLVTCWILFPRPLDFVILATPLQP